MSVTNLAFTFIDEGFFGHTEIVRSCFQVAHILVRGDANEHMFLVSDILEVLRAMRGTEVCVFE